jgi:hypothetical protein
VVVAAVGVAKFAAAVAVAAAAAADCVAYNSVAGAVVQTAGELKGLVACHMAFALQRRAASANKVSDARMGKHAEFFWRRISCWVCVQKREGGRGVKEQNC